MQFPGESVAANEQRAVVVWGSGQVIACEFWDCQPILFEQARLAPTEPPLLVHAKLSSICLAEALSK